MLIQSFNILVTITGVFMSLTRLPRARKITKIKSAKDISIPTYTLFTFDSPTVF